ncbi:hypothetical protein I4U23_003917 [Adineta vaga]|nr:hypothetical protein I4U23_003917 [Adineta vaga]
MRDLTKLAVSMLKSLSKLAGDSILIFDYPSLVDLNMLPKKPTLLFVSNEYMSTIGDNKPEHIKRIFILEKDKTKVDQRERFGTGEDLICQLADELYRCYKKEARNYFISGDSAMGEKKEKQANQIFSGLKEVHQQYLKSNSGVTDSTTVTLLWLKSNMEDNILAEKVQQAFEKVVSSFLISENLSQCENYLLDNKSFGVCFMILGSVYEEKIIDDFQKFSNIKGFYRYDTQKNNYDELCLQLACDLMAYYNKLGDEYKAKKDTKKAKDMFMKAHELCEILNDF